MTTNGRAVVSYPNFYPAIHYSEFIGINGSGCRQIQRCHGLVAVGMDRNTMQLLPIGHEDSDWNGVSHFVDTPQIFQNMCEGYSDCSVQSNCISILPLETEYGRKRKIDQSTCNKDYSCVNGFCSSFVTVFGDTRVAACRVKAEPSALYESPCSFTTAPNSS